MRLASSEAERESEPAFFAGDIKPLLGLFAMKIFLLLTLYTVWLVIGAFYFGFRFAVYRYRNNGLSKD